VYRGRLLPGRLSLMSEPVEVHHVRYATQEELETLADVPVALMYPLDGEVVATHCAAPAFDAGEQRELPAEVMDGVLPPEIVAVLQGVQDAYNALPESDHGSFRAEIQKFIHAAIKQLRMVGGGAKPKRPDAYRFLDEKRAGRRRPARVAAYHAMDTLIAICWPSARRAPVASMPAQAPHAAAGTPSQPALEVTEVVVMPPGWTPEEDALAVVDAHLVLEEAPDAAAVGTSALMSAVPASLDDETSSPSRKKAKLSSDAHSEGSEGATRVADPIDATPTPRLQPMPEAHPLL
jgi:hypothetical protein